MRKLEIILKPLSLPHPLWSTAQFCDAYCCKLLMYLCLITAMHKCMREVLGDAFVNGNSMMPMRLSLPASVQAAISSFDSDPQLGMGEALNSFVLLCAGVALNGFTLRLIGVPGVPRLLSLTRRRHSGCPCIFSMSNSYNPYLYPLDKRFDGSADGSKRLTCHVKDSIVPHDPSQND